ncbi:MAG TPA: endonuclease V [Syntrophorhabdaceae bacterium]|jgi:deoxyribonuclease V
MDGELGIYPIYTLWKMVEKAYENRDISIVGAVDVAYRDDRYFSALTLYKNGVLTDIKTDSGISRGAYVSSLFFLKEGPIVSRLVYGEPMDLLFLNGHGICHPYNYGLATVIGFTHRIPTVGIARRLIKGRYDRILSRDPSFTYITQEGKITGVGVNSETAKKPIFLSQGFGITIERMMVEYLKWTPKGKMPEPLRLAHVESMKLARAGG